MSRRRFRPRPEQLLAMSDLDRRLFLRGAGMVGLGLGAPGLLAACGTEGAQQKEGECASTDLSDEQKEINFSNWIGYVDPVKTADASTLEKFEAETGITVDYNSDINDNESFFAKVLRSCGACGPTGRDVFVVTDYMAARMVGLNWIQKLDHSNMPNVKDNLIPFLQSPQWDPEREYSVPWQSGMTGICYNSELTDPVASFRDLLTRPDLKGKVELLTEMRDTMLFLLLMTESDPEDFSDDEFTAAIDELQKHVDNGHVRRFAGNDYVDDMKTGDIVACEAWSGDVINLLGGDPIKWVPPEEGFAIWTDNMLVPNKAEHKTNVEQLMNFYYDPVIAAQLAAWNYYFCPVAGAQDEIGQFDKSAGQQRVHLPRRQDARDRLPVHALSEDQSTTYQRQFNEVMGG